MDEAAPVQVPGREECKAGSDGRVRSKGMLESDFDWGKDHRSTQKTGQIGM